ncbi:lipid II flippase MurJ [Streptomyces sp. NPDC047000]|uniref:murein biosynthesis integral membrane protein MurJ n=1 Tax=Streptomyces sp. NPDC047000 TaxID=3155474 RepID=UPI0033DFC1A1
MTVTPSRSPGAEAEAAADTHAAAAPRIEPVAGATAPSRAFLARAALVTAALSLAGAVLGLVRDQSLAGLFGAGSATDAFLVAWTVPEFAATLLIEDGLAFVLIPAFSAALARRARDAREGPGAAGTAGVPGVRGTAAGDPVRTLVTGTLPRLTLAFVGVAVLLIAAAPVLVRALAPGLPDPGLAVDCTRLTATCVLSFGLAGYSSAALRAHRRFVAPAAIYVAYNTGIVAGMLVLGGRWGVRSAAAGVAVGGLLMVAVQLPSLLRQLRTQPTTGQEVGAPPGRGGAQVPCSLGLRLVGAVLLFALCRQSQVLVERFLASGLPSGAISHLNYAQKVAQLPMTLALMLCTVTFPVITRALADGDTERARDRVERDLGLVACLALLGTAAVVACAPQIIGLLFQRGAFTAHDTAATAAVMRVYAVGLLGQTLVGVLVRSYFSTGRATWYPLGAMTAGVVVTAWAGSLAVGPWGATGIAAANATGITVTAALLLTGLHAPGGPRGPRVPGLPGRSGRPGRGSGRGRGRHRMPRGVPVRAWRVLGEVSRPAGAAAVAAAAGAWAAGSAGPGAPLPGLAAGTVTVTGVFVLAGRVLNAPGVAQALRTVRTVTRRGTHALLRRHP